MSAGLHSLATIIKRLEAATARIEDLAQSSGWPTATTDELIGQTGSSQSSYPGAPLAPPPPPAPMSDALPRSITAFDQNVVDGALTPFLALTKEFATENVVESVNLVEKQFKDLRILLVTATACQKPDDEGFKKLISEFEPTIKQIVSSRETNRKDREWLNHYITLAEGAPTLGWVAMPTPASYISNIKESVEFYANRVKKDFKDKDPKHGEWVGKYLRLIEELRKYVHEFHTTGLAWNAKGVPVSAYSPSTTTGTQSPAASGAPPPPPPPPPPAAAPATEQTGGTSAVFAALNRGEEVTKGLRKVDKSEMTHKNPALRASSTVPSGPPTPTAGKKPLKPAKPQALAGKKPSKLALEGKVWNIEYQENERALVIDQAEINQAINIFGCKSSTIQIKGKVNAVSLINCEKTAVLVDSVVSSISVTKSPSFALQVTGTAPMIQVDSTDSGQIYLSKACLSVEVTTAKCSAINISIPVEGEEDGVFAEQAVPEMLRTVVKNGKLVTTVVEHVG